MRIRNLLIHYVLTGDILPVGEDSPSDVRVTASALRTIRDAARAGSEKPFSRRRSSFSPQYSGNRFGMQALRADFTGIS